ncbi:MAG: hypothetical protein K8S62_08045 [Candidatus Sabulitectum sp.]|nr:hypothetical protein [Candidatus Sabulitectum sp.]
MKLIAAVSLTTFIAILACGSSPSSSTPDSLATVQGFEVNRSASKGDTVVLEWTPLSQDVDGYHIYSQGLDADDWSIIGSSDGSTWTHIASSTGEYCVKAYKDDKLSLSYSSLDTTTAYIDNTYLLYPVWVTADSNGFFVNPDGAGGASGPAGNADFMQDFYIEMVDNTIIVYSGNNNPSLYPGGHTTKLCSSSSLDYVAPEAESSQWVDSIPITEPLSVFLQMEEGYYSILSIDNISADSIRVASIEYQSIDYLRLFNSI